MENPGPAIRAVVVDFDGTICPQDVSEELLAVFGDATWWDIDLAFQRGEIGSRECLVRQAALLRAGRDEMLAHALERFSLEPSFEPFVRWAKGRAMEVAIASDGFGFYVEPMLAAAGVTGVPVLTNDLAFTPEGPGVDFPFGHSVCLGCGTCKMEAVRRHRVDGGRVAFVGEGHSDRYGALYADLVFAKKHLVAICEADGVPSLPWQTFDDIREGLERADPIPSRVDPPICPGWITA